MPDAIEAFVHLVGNFATCAKEISLVLTVSKVINKKSGRSVRRSIFINRLIAIAFATVYYRSQIVVHCHQLLINEILLMGN